VRPGIRKTPGLEIQRPFIFHIGSRDQIIERRDSQEMCIQIQCTQNTKLTIQRSRRCSRSGCRASFMDIRSLPPSCKRWMKENKSIVTRRNRVQVWGIRSAGIDKVFLDRPSQRISSLRQERGNGKVPVSSCLLPRVRGDCFT
jgi:hypothetical protein